MLENLPGSPARLQHDTGRGPRPYTGPRPPSSLAVRLKVPFPLRAVPLVRTGPRDPLPRIQGFLEDD